MLVVLTGQNDFLLTRELKKRVDTFVSEYGDLALERLNGDESSFEQLYDAITTLPFLASEKLVVLRSPSNNKQFVDSIESLVAAVPETTTVLLVEPKLDKRSSYYKFLKKQPEYHEFLAANARDLVRFVQEEVKERQGSISVQDAQYVVEMAGEDQLLLVNEISKLITYNSSITKDSITALIEPTSQSKIFDLIDAAFAQNPQRALDLYAEQRSQKVEPQAIIGMLVWQLHALAIVKTAGAGKPPAEIASSSKLSPFVIQKTQSIARRVDANQLKRLIRELEEIDFASKTKAYDLDQALQNYILTI